MSVTKENISEVKKMFHKDREVEWRQIEETLNLNAPKSRSNLKTSKFHCLCVPRSLTEKLKTQSVN